MVEIIQDGVGANRFEKRLVRSKNTALTWAAVLMWGAFSLLLDAVNFGNGTNWDGGVVFGLGAGVILLVSGLIMFLGAPPRRGMMFRFILGFLFLAAGIDQFTSVDDNIVVATIFVAIAMAILINTFKRPR